MIDVCLRVFPGGSSAEEPARQCRRRETWVQSVRREDPLEEGMATHSSILAWRIPRTVEPGGLQSIELRRVSMTEASEHAHSSPYDAQGMLSQSRALKDG